MEYDDDIDNDVEDIISQIKNQSKMMRRVEREPSNLKKEDMEDFIIQNASSIVKDTIDIVGALKIEIMAGATPEMLESFSTLVKATTSAIDSLSKLKLAEDKLKGQKEITQMNIDAKMSGNEETSKGLLMTREDMLKLLMSSKAEQKVIDV